MNEVLVALGKQPLICFTLDGATNLQGKQVINMMACLPKAYFLEHFTMKLRRESVANLLKKLLDCKLWLLSSIRKPAPGCTLSRDGFADMIAHGEGDNVGNIGIVAATGATNTIREYCHLHRAPGMSTSSTPRCSPYAGTHQVLCQSFAETALKVTSLCLLTDVRLTLSTTSAWILLDTLQALNWH
jgi:hypothetical protein